ncbi:sulfurtransferase TusA family protein [Geobacter sulfurreducens]|uniref:tRNA (5-carboxymethylaminomethyl-2-thio-U34) synthesis sulfur carrier protein n=1 Tax=Geobacter sulfurreducens (strain ATCC 51573 / DSM 12127 / PCA) TaxID=243231 RepID=Q74EA9_GEOSL|nr:sulfurtransferase TusA family protein [Geobacter sulfurreducens]AAR34380.1 tRNA (5-carboxymethylaminomethyl-2-thio-U34) synthesis sulfur carrier protein [Geobacter sulfurreducens PCA]ADI83893.1 tRNA (5-carboxymethylaminomethyl-2-thio-U34) synthesis sulfur carrier protein [Geobacter sulfurreducens KN400]AJY70777.1 tRNA methyltransferase [Geobacter sulfurreducens]UAC05100.1 sulfurtransferase TusA family protein [Geobacter sulfurreducens]UTG93738.1 sulfurtransferase TusA family protein [Geobac
METIEFDIRGQICPSTLLTALKEINRHRTSLKNGNCVLVFLTDNRDATITIPETVRNMGYGGQVEKRNGYYVLTISQAGGSDGPH